MVPTMHFVLLIGVTLAMCTEDDAAKCSGCLPALLPSFQYALGLHVISTCDVFMGHYSKMC